MPDTRTTAAPAQPDAPSVLAPLLQAVDLLGDAVLVTDRDAVIVHVNAAFERITGYQRDEVLGRPTSLLRSGHHDDALYQRLWGALLAGQTLSAPYVNARKDGSLYEIENTLSPICSSDGTITHFVAIGRDVTRRNALHRQLARHNGLDEGAALTRSIGNDFRNALTIIGGSAQMALDLLEEDHEARDDVKAIVDNVRRVSLLVAQLVAHASPGA